MDRKIYLTQLYNVLRNDRHMDDGDILDIGKWMSLTEDDIEYNSKSLSIDLTSTLKLGCRHCLTNNKDIAEIYINTELLESIVKWAEQQGIESITVTGEGIHLMPNMNKLLFLLKQNFSGQVDIITDERF